jgi:hypothetical protein
MLRVVNSPVSPQARVALEREVLQVLCGAASDSAFRAECFVLLASYRFIEPEHQVMFDALRGLPPSDTRVLRERLIVRLNNQGFPDIDLSHFFASASPPSSAALVLVGRLADLGPASPTKAGRARKNA